MVPQNLSHSHEETQRKNLATLLSLLQDIEETLEADPAQREDDLTELREIHRLCEAQLAQLNGSKPAEDAQRQADESGPDLPAKDKLRRLA